MIYLENIPGSIKEDIVNRFKSLNEEDIDDMFRKRS